MAASGSCRSKCSLRPGRGRHLTPSQRLGSRVVDDEVDAPGAGDYMMVGDNVPVCPCTRPLPVERECRNANHREQLSYDAAPAGQAQAQKMAELLHSGLLFPAVPVGGGNRAGVQGPAAKPASPDGKTLPRAAMPLSRVRAALSALWTTHPPRLRPRPKFGVAHGLCKDPRFLSKSLLILGRR